MQSAKRVVLAVLLAATAVAAEKPLALVDGEPVALNDLELGGKLIQLEQQRYQILQEALDAAIADRLMAAAAAREGTSFDEYVAREVTGNVDKPDAEMVQGFYEKNRLRIGRPLEDVRGAIEGFLLQSAIEARRKEVVAKLRGDSSVEILLEPPRAPVKLAGAHRRGPAEAPVKIVEFSDFQCPFCKRMQDVLTKVVAKYDGQVSWYYKDLPLVSIHSGAKYAAEAARCAGDQGKFWEYRDALFAADKVTDSMHQQLATDLKLDLGVFQGCLSEHKYQKAVEDDLVEAENLGITATPTVMINGILLSGARTVESLSEVIDRELERGE